MKKIATFVILLCCLTTASYELNAQSASKTKKTERLARKAGRYYQDFYYIKAIEFYDKALSVDPGHRLSMLGMARSYVKINDPANAQRWYDKAIPDFANADREDLLNYAKAMASNGNYDEAQKIYSFIANQDQGAVASQLVQGYADLKHFYIDSLKYSVRLSEVNSPEADFSPSFFENGIIFASSREKKGMFRPIYNWDNSFFLDLYYAELDGDKMTGVPELLPPVINTIYHEGPLTTYDNETKMIFTKNNFGKNNATPIEDAVTRLELYYTQRQAAGKKWEKPVPLVLAPGDYSFGHPAASPDGSVLYFVSDMPGGYGMTDIYKSEFRDGQWQAPVNLGETINTPANEMFPYYADSSTLYFASDGHKGLGGMDIFKAVLDESGAYEVNNMGYPINTSKDDFGLVIQDKRGYFSSNRDGGTGGDDIYWFNVHTLMINPIVIVDAVTGVELEGNVEVFDKTKFREIDVKKKNQVIYFESIGGYEYIFNASSEGYISRRIELHTRDIPRDQEPYRFVIPLEKHLKEVDILLVKNYGRADQVFRIDEHLTPFAGTIELLKETLVENNEQLRHVIEVSNIYHDFDKWEIQTASLEQMEKLVSILERFPEAKIILSAFTDSRGSKRYNEKLAKKRVKQVGDYLRAAGIAKERLEESSFGEEVLVTACPDEVDCSEEEHQLNRRTELKVLLVPVNQNLSGSE